jgi:hypothetical protein
MNRRTLALGCIVAPAAGVALAPAAISICKNAAYVPKPVDPMDRVDAALAELKAALIAVDPSIARLFVSYPVEGLGSEDPCRFSVLALTTP